MGVTLSRFLCREIVASVGPAMTNNKPDVLAVQRQLNAHLPQLVPAQPTVSETGNWDNATSQAIVAFQRLGMKHTTPSGRVHPRGSTMASLNQLPGSAAVGNSRKPIPNASISDYLGALGLRHFPSSEFVGLMANIRRFTPDPANPDHQGLPTVRATNSKPPRNVWDNFIPIAIVLDQIREELSYSLTVTNSYRSKAYNDGLAERSKARKVVAARIAARANSRTSTANMNNVSSGVSSRSQHMTFRAVDWHGSAGNVGTWHDKAKEMRGRRFALPWPISMNDVTIAGAGNIPFNEAGLLLTDGDFEYHGGIGRYEPRQGNFIHIDCRGTDDDW